MLFSVHKSLVQLMEFILIILASQSFHMSHTGAMTRILSVDIVERIWEKHNKFHSGIRVWKPKCDEDGQMDRQMLPIP